MAKQEPRLQRLLDRVDYIRAADKHFRPERFCANAQWYGYGGVEQQRDSLRSGVCELVGWDAALPELRSEDAYDVAYRYLSERLPDCRNCGCPS